MYEATFKYILDVHLSEYINDIWEDESKLGMPKEK